MSRIFCGLLLAAAFASGCGDDTGTSAPPDAPIVDAAPADASCFTNPQTHLEIINACTDAFSIARQPANLPNPLPQLP